MSGSAEISNQPDEFITYLQPIVSVPRQRVMACEALTRTMQGESIVGIIRSAKDKDCFAKLNELFINKALQAYKASNLEKANVFLTLNCDPEFIRACTNSNNYQLLTDGIRRLGLDAGSIILEILETEQLTDQELSDFVEALRPEGFMFALDDIGAGFSSLARISLVKPDFIKIDISLVRGIDTDYTKQEIVRALVRMADRLACLVIAEGVEERSELLCLISLGVDALQGFLLARPQDAARYNQEETVQHLEDIFAGYSRQIERMISEVQAANIRYHNVLLKLKEELAQIESAAMESHLLHWAAEEGIECLYVIDMLGRQLTPTVGRPAKRQSTKSLFRPARRGDTHSLRSYYLSIRAGQQFTITDPYISMATGNMCRTAAIRFDGLENQSFILCIDFTTD